MDVDPEFLGQGDSIVNSTEVDDHPKTLNPSNFTYGGNERLRSATPNASQDLPFITQPPLISNVVLSPSQENPVTFNSLARKLTEDDAERNEYASTAPHSSAGNSSQNSVQGAKHTPYPAVQVLVPASRYTPLPYSTSQSGLVYDTRMRFHCELQPEFDDIHPEDPARISEIFQELVSAGLLQDPLDKNHPALPPELQLARIHCRQATVPEIALVHTEEHIDWVKDLANWSQETLIEVSKLQDSVYLHNQSWLCASLSAGGAIEATRAVVAGQVKNAVAIIRPPGHHAEHVKPSGFCFFNNVCIAAKVCQQDFADQCRKILILDWDVHHGNGVQEAFYDDPNVLYTSLHVHQNGTFYPSGSYGDHLHCGGGFGIGKNVNIPWTHAGMTDADYLYAFQQIVMPIAYEFNPDLVIISAGFDAAEGDLLGKCHVSPACYGHMTHMLMQLAKGKVVACLEGGYNLRSIAKSALSMTRTLMGEPPERLLEPMIPTAPGVNTVQIVVRQQAKFWQCMYPKSLDQKLKPELHPERLHDVVRSYQAKALYDQHGMTSLPILRQKISKSFDNQVLATQNYEENRPLLIIFHDPPDALGIPNPLTSKLELHNAFITDVSKLYIEWAVRHSFSVIDVNIPKHLTGIEDSADYADADPGELRSEMARELAVYLWENYVEVNNSSHIFLLGIGDACAGLTELLKSNEGCLDQVDCAISFVAENSLRRVIRPDDDSASAKYHSSSLVFVSSDHPVWEQRKLKRSFGHVIKSPYTELSEILLRHQGTVAERLLSSTKEWRTGQADAMDTSIEDAEVNTNNLDVKALMALFSQIADGKDNLPGEEDAQGRLP